MSKSPIFQSFWFQEALRLLVLEAVLLFLFWLLYRYAGVLQNFPFGDALFVFGGAMLMIAGFGMLRGDPDLAESPQRFGPAPAVVQNRSEVEHELKRKNSFGVRLAICGGLTILLSVIIYLINKAGG